MRKSILFLLLCVVVNKVTAPVPYNSSTRNLPSNNPTVATQSKLPKWNDYVSKTSGSKPIKDNGYLATLVKKPPKDNSKFKPDIKKIANSTNTDNIELTNTTKVLYAEEIVMPVELPAGNDKEIETSNMILTEKEMKQKEVAAELKSLDKAKLNTTEPKKGVKLQDLFKPLSKPKVNNTDQPKKLEIPPTMIPIFRPNPNIAKSQGAKENLDPILTVPSPVVTSTEKPAPVENPVPNEEKPAKKPNPNSLPFNIPCHRASDVLEEVPTKPEVIRNSHIKEPIPKVNLEPNQVERPENLDTDELGIVFKPKNISLLNVYGDLMKKITLTVLVPYHMSKLGSSEQR